MNSHKILLNSDLITRLPREVWIGWIASAIEAYNMTIYSFIAPLLAKQMFHEATWNAVFFSYFLVFIGTCFLYPLGAIYYSYIGDKEGRQKTCIYSTLGLALATGLMGLVPFQLLAGYSWICFLILIGAQHFFSGGEYYGSIVFTLEHAEERQKGIMSSLSCLFAVMGLVAANGLATLSFLTENESLIRICFFVGAIGGIISYQLKNRCQETPAFNSLSKEVLEKTNWSSFLKMEWQKIGSVVMVCAFFAVSYSFIFIFLPLIHIEQMTSHSFDTFKSLIMYGLFLLIAGRIADWFEIDKVLILGASLFAIIILPLCYFCTSLLVLQSVLTICACLVIGPIHSWLLSQFDIQHRCRGIFISSAIATAIFYGSTVPLCMMIFESFHSLIICALYPMAVALAAIWSLIHLKQRKKVLVVAPLNHA